VPHVFERASVPAENSVALVIGPPIMIKNTLPVLYRMGIKSNVVYTSLENRMKCGVGKCGHCGIGYKYTCLQGPIFTYWDALNLPEMI